MKKILFLLLFVLCASFANSQQTFKFGNVTLKDTLSGSIKMNGSIFIQSMETDEIKIDGDAGDFLIAGQGSGLLFYMSNDIIYFDSQSVTLLVPFYLAEFSTSEIGGLSVNNGAMVINSDTDEVWVYLHNEWKILDTK